MAKKNLTWTYLGALGLSSLCLSLSPFSTFAQEAKEAIEPEFASPVTGRTETQIDEGARFMAVTANPHATRAAFDILKSGGTALDAGIAAQTVLGLTEPQSSGLGGGAFMLYWDATQQQLFSYDGRETAPATLDNRLFYKDDGTKKRFMEAVTGGSSIGVPGLLRMFELARKNHGGQSLDILLDPARKLAETGFEVSPRLNSLLTRDKYLKESPTAQSYFYSPDGKALPVGHRLKNPDYARTLSLLAEQGLSAFYNGEIAEAITRQAQKHGGQLSLSDMSNYQAVQRSNLCQVIQEKYELCGMAPPSSGGLAVGQIMGVLEHSDIAKYPPINGQWSKEGVQIFAEAMKLAHADRDFYVGDDDFVEVPKSEMLSPAYLKHRAKGMDLGTTPKKRAKPGQPKDHANLNWAPSVDQSLPSTTHLVMVDAFGNALSMTSSIENAFGSRIMAAGFLLNNQLTDFSSLQEKDGIMVANRASPNKRPRSSMAPTLLFQDGQFKMAIGSPGGSRIIGYVAKSLTAYLHWNTPLAEAIAMPHFLHRNNKLELEDQPGNQALFQEMKAMGYDPQLRTMTSGIHAIVKDPVTNQYFGFADPRREGLAVGQ